MAVRHDSFRTRAGGDRPGIVPPRGSELRFRTVHGYRRAFRVAGSGPPVMLIHGIGDSSATWEPILPTPARQHLVIAPDLDEPSARPPERSATRPLDESSVRTTGVDESSVRADRGASGTSIGTDRLAAGRAGQPDGAAPLRRRPIGSGVDQLQPLVEPQPSQR